MPIVKQVDTDKKGMKDFIGLPYSLYRNVPQWCPPLRLERKKFFSPDNPFMQHSQVAYFVAYDGNTPVGRVTAHIDSIYNKYYNTRQGFFGFFEAIESKEVARALMQAGETWLKSRQMDSIMGPFNFSTNHEIGFLIRGFDRPPVIMMPYTHKYYPGLLTELGYKKEKELLAFFMDKDTEIPGLFATMARRVSKELGDTVEIQNFDLKDLKSQLKIILDIYNDAWDKNWGFVPMTDREIDLMASQLKLFADTNFIYILHKDGEPAAFLLALPDINEVFARIPSGRLFPTGIFKLLTFRKYIKTGRILLMGVKSRFRNQGLDILLYHRMIQNSRTKTSDQVRNLEMSWILEDNTVMINILKSLNADPYKSYLIVKKAL